VYGAANERHERLPWESRAPVPDQEVTVLRALFVGVCALVLVTHAAAAAKKNHHPAVTRQAKREHVVAASPEQHLEHQLDIVRRQRSALRFFEAHRSLLRSGEHRSAARTSLQHATVRLARAERAVTWLERIIRARDARRLETLPPKAAICDAFDRYCGEAIQVARCESRLQPNARNGQYLGLFQMGSYARQLYGHGSTAHDQAVAAHRYFISSGRDWSPWSCKPLGAY
jgi:hypothetical protein